MNKKILLGAGIGIIVAIGAFFYLPKKQAPTQGQPNQSKDLHFIDSTPLSGEVYASQPINITLNFNTDLVESSSIDVLAKDNQQWTTGNIKIEDSNTALKRDLKQNMPDGEYLVKYKACFLDSSCEENNFNFKIDSAKKTEYQDLRGSAEVTVNMNEFNFDKQKIIISPNTKVIWKNTGNVGHFVNTETHPEHTYFPEHNSREIGPLGTFETTFTIKGQYNYHCSAHHHQGMLGSIIVE